MAARETELTSSAQIFTTHTLPHIRTLHKTLHTQIDEKSARLRTQVGNSYRQLLGTADTIVHMRQDMLSAQDVLGRMGGHCSRAAVEDKIAGSSRFAHSYNTDADLAHTARLRLLRACALAVSRLLKTSGSKSTQVDKGDRLLLAAKVLVLSRLLVPGFGSLGILDDELKLAVETTRKNLDALRRKLIRAVEKVLQNAGEETDINVILRALSAYSLASSSGAKDILRLFLNIRAQATTDEFDQMGTENVLRGLELYTRTLVDVQMLVPTRLREALLELKKNPLLADESLRSIEDLRLDVFKPWCGDEIRYFTPFISHDELDGQQAKDMLTSWARKGGEAVLDGLAKTIEQMSDFKAVLDLRTSVLQQWIKDGGKARGFDPSIMLDGLRKALNEHLLELIETKVAKLKLVSSEVSATLDAWQSGVTDRPQSLWDATLLEADLSIGATRVINEVVSRVSGRNDAVARAVTGFESWHQIVDTVSDLIAQLRGQRWENDVDEIEDEEVINERQQLLSKDDPQLLHVRLNSTLARAFEELDVQLTTLWQSRSEGADSGPIAMYFLRVVRHVRNHLSQLEGVQSFGLESVPSLHEKLALHVSMSPIEEFASTALTLKRVAGRALWEGEPPLPTQLSPGAFKLLRNLTMSMGGAGIDLWTPVALNKLRTICSRQLADVWRKELAANAIETDASELDTKSAGAMEDNSPPEGKPDEGDTTEEPIITPERSQDVYIQWLFDIRVLDHYLALDGASSDGPLETLALEIPTKSDLGSEEEQRLAKAAQEYWKRTSLLFGLLA
ncbi:hypothetical protein F5Y18DRAFT_59955 [Xylariaceae sp. FL1019]|nr:hypothetical protein F5Y18DRAFT_59955 [Xylariaceae sp. FL1019]